jgi:hypothetical protein
MGILQSSKLAPTPLKVSLDRFKSFSDGLTGLVTSESAKPTTAVSLADLEESAQPTVAAG